MRILIMTVGSRGDVQPFVALAAAAQAAGHEVALSTAGQFAPLVEAHGVPFAPTSNALLDLMDEPVIREALETLNSLGQAVRQMPRLVRLAGAAQAALIDDSWDIVQEVMPDVIVYSPKAYWGPSFAAEIGACAVHATLQPFYVATGERPLPAAPALPLGAAYNRLTYQAVAFGMAMSVRRYLGDWRRATGGTTPKGPVPTMQGFSRHVVPQPADSPDHATTSGYWFLNDAAPLPPDLDAFLDAGPPPVYVGFGSMAGRDPGGLAAVVVEGLRAAGVRSVLATGWGGLEGAASGDDILVIEGASHQALFPRCAAVVHHGGAGTTAAGLRAGRPTVICPFFGDQPFWGQRVHALGAGPKPIPKKSLTPARLAAAVTEAVTDDAIRQRAEALGAALRAEDGAGEAVRFVEGVCR